MFSLQLHIPLASPLGQRLSLLQHLMAVAMVNAVLSIDGYEVSKCNYLSENEKLYFVGIFEKKKNKFMFHI